MTIGDNKVVKTQDKVTIVIKRSDGSYQSHYDTTMIER